MNKYWLVFGVVGLVSVIFGFYLHTPKSIEVALPPVPADVVCTEDAQLCPDGSFVGRTGPRCKFVCPEVVLSSSTAAAVAAMADVVHLTTPVPESVVTSPLRVTGEARGTWFFEGTFPVTIEDDEGNVLGSSIARASTDAMTTEFVPFTAEIAWKATTTALQLRLRKDNPSGLPENDMDMHVLLRVIPVIPTQSE